MRCFFYFGELFELEAGDFQDDKIIGLDLIESCQERAVAYVAAQEDFVVWGGVVFGIFKEVGG